MSLLSGRPSAGMLLSLRISLSASHSPAPGQLAQASDMTFSLDEFMVASSISLVMRPRRDSRRYFAGR